MPPPSPALAATLRAVSPRYTRPPTPPASLLVHGLMLALFLLVLARACAVHGLGTWSAGILYAGYDTFLLAFTVAQTWPLHRPLGAPATATPPAITVIIAARNEAAGLPRTLAALLAQTAPPAAILVADDGSTDATAAALAPFGLAPPPVGGTATSPLHPGLAWMRLPPGGKAAALNAALPHAKTPIIVTLDADTRLDPPALAAMQAAFAADPNLVAATGVLRPDAPGAPILQFFQTYEYIRNFLGRFAWMRADGLLLISGALAGFRRDALLAVGGFDPDCLVEDYEAIHRLRRTGADQGLAWRTAVVGAATAITDAPASLGAFLRQRRRWFGGFLQTQFWYRDMVANPRYGRLGTLMLPVKAADTLQPLYGLTAFAVLCALLARGETSVLAPVSAIVATKIGIDLAFHLWGLHLYRAWTGGAAGTRFGLALLAAIVEPFSFQLVRHTGAVWGWATVLTGQRGWAPRGQARMQGFALAIGPRTDGGPMASPLGPEAPDPR